jgi:thiamine pyrophosphate-dependent acetolactate synthase large subunit-like protein
MAMVTGGELLVRTLHQAGVRHVFGIHGAHLETVFQACRSHDIPIVDTRHEVAAGHAAEGYARSLRQLGVAMGTAGPGFTNLLTSIANAYLDHSPVLYLSGSAALSQAETNTLQAGIDQLAIAKPITKWAHQITVTRDIPRLTAQALRIATTAPMGPVLLDLPMDVLSAQLDESSAPIPKMTGVDFAPPPPSEAVVNTIALLRQAERPIILVGGGAWYSKAEDELRRFVDATGIPVYSDFQAHGLLPSNHPLYGGTFHKLADQNAPGHRPDVVLALGVRFGLFTLGASDLLVPAAAKLIHVDTDAREIGRLRDVAIGIMADSREVLRELNNQVSGQSWPDWSGWLRAIQQSKTARRQRLYAAAQERRSGSEGVHPYHAVAAIADAIDEDTIVIGDGAEAYHWFNEVVRQNRPGSYLTHGFLGAVGHGLGLSLGAQVAQPGRRVLCLAGDGAVGFTIAEFDTMVRLRLPIVVVVMNNRSWAASQHFQEMVSGKDKLVGTQLANTRYDEVAAAFGCHAQRVTEAAAVGPAIKAAFESGKPACINVIVDVDPPPPELELLAKR